MPRRIKWTKKMDEAIYYLRDEGYSWELISQKVGVERKTLVKHAKEVLGIDTSVVLNSGRIDGRKVRQGVRPRPERFEIKAELKRLGRI